MATRNRLSSDQLFDIYYKRTHGSRVADIASAMGKSQGVVSGVMKTIRRYIAWISDGTAKTRGQLRTNYLKAAKRAIEADRISIKKGPDAGGDIKLTFKESLVVPAMEASSGAPFPPLPQAVIQERSLNLAPDHFARLELAFALFTDAVQSCIQAEVKRQVGEIMAENDSLKAKLDEARLGNWTDSLRKKFN